ncbi:MAG: PorV/PorQ family protein [Endomicrobiales bacterium]|nr:PorV/PorQ family protein [Endomicrobiales bacterium]
MKKLIIIISILISSIQTNLSAAVLGLAREDGGVPGAFLSYGAGARALGMGKAFVGVSDDASSVYWNAAGTTQLENPQICALYASLYEETGFGFASYARPFSGGAIGAALVNLNSGGFQLRDELNYETGIGSLSETAGIVSYARPVISGGKLSCGVSLKIVNQRINALSDTGYGIDAGLMWNAIPAVSLGLNVQNIVAPTLKLKENADVYPLSVTAGLGWKVFSNKLLVAIDVNKTEGRQVKTRLGAEYVFLDMFAVRAGLDETELATGAGFRWGDYSLDYAFAYHDAWSGHENLGISHRVGFSVNFR